VPWREETTKSHYTSVRAHPASEKSNLSENTCWLALCPGSKTTRQYPSSRVSCFSTDYRHDWSARSRGFGRCQFPGFSRVVWARPHDHHQLCRVGSSCAQTVVSVSGVGRSRVGVSCTRLAVTWGLVTHSLRAPPGQPKRPGPVGNRLRPGREHVARQKTC